MAPNSLSILVCTDLNYYLGVKNSRILKAETRDGCSPLPFASRLLAACQSLGINISRVIIALDAI